MVRLLHPGSLCQLGLLIYVLHPLPVPLPAVGQVIEHRLPDGRWLQVLATELPEGDGRVVTLRDITEAHRREQARELFVAVTSHELLIW